MSFAMLHASASLECLTVAAVATLCGMLSCTPTDAPAPRPTSAPLLVGAAEVADPEVTVKAPKPSAPPHALRDPEGEPAYFVLDRALVQLDAAGFDTLAVDEPLYSLQLARNGKLHAIAFDAVLALDGGVLAPITSRAAEGIQAVHVIADDDIWATRMAELVHWDGQQWRHETVAPIDALKTDFSIELSPTGVVVDRDARVWLSSERDVMVKDDRGWHTLARSKLGGRPKQLWLDKDGSAQLQLETNRFVRLPAEPTAAPARGTAPRDSAWLERHGETWSVVHADSGNRLHARALGREIDGLMALAHATDTRGRLWVGTAAGVTIFDAATAIAWPMGSMPALDGQVDEILVVGDGPDAVPAAGPTRRGGMRARLVKDGKPIAGARVEVCTHALAVTVPPCALSRPSSAATSDADGSFTIDGLAVGIWDIAVQVDGEWRVLNRGLEPFRLAVGDATDFGELDATRGMIAREERKRRR